MEKPVYNAVCFGGAGSILVLSGSLLIAMDGRDKFVLGMILCVFGLCVLLGTLALYRRQTAGRIVPDLPFLKSTALLSVITGVFVYFRLQHVLQNDPKTGCLFCLFSGLLAFCLMFQLLASTTSRIMAQKEAKRR